MTPWQFSLACSAFAERRNAEQEFSIWVMWHNAALQRSKKMPALDKLLKRNKTVARIDEAAIMGQLKAYQKRRADNGN